MSRLPRAKREENNLLADLAFPITLTGWKARPAVCRLPSAVYLPSTVIAPLPSAIPIRLFVPLYSLTVTPTVYRPTAVRRPSSNSAVCRLTGWKARPTRPPPSKKNPRAHCAGVSSQQDQRPDQANAFSMGFSFSPPLL
jgi:hypothetical protein